MVKGCHRPRYAATLNLFRCVVFIPRQLHRKLGKKEYLLALFLGIEVLARELSAEDQPDFKLSGGTPRPRASSLISAIAPLTCATSRPRATKEVPTLFC